MRGNAFLFIVIGLLLFYVVITDKFYCVEGCVSCLAKGESNNTFGSGLAAAAQSNSASSPLTFKPVIDAVKNNPLLNAGKVVGLP